MRPFLSFLAVGLLSLSFALVARADVVVVELFTSQGCSSCPPADEILGELATRDDVLALSLHVDYWDYLGWTDEFAKPEHTERQKGYATAVQSSMIYTPQMVVNGQDILVGTKAMKLAERIQAHMAQPARVKVSLARAGETLFVTLTPVAPVPEGALVQLVRFAPVRAVKIKSGENAGREITYHNVVTSLQALGDWNGQSELEMQAPLPGDEEAAVVVQDGPSGPILAAARLD